MSKNKKHKPREVIVPVNSGDKVMRWHLCQQIGVLYYKSESSFDLLLQMYEYLERHGVIE